MSGIGNGGGAGTGKAPTVVHVQPPQAGSSATQQFQTGSGDVLEITPLGAGCEVGRSCLYLQCKGRRIMLDCGMHPGREGIQSLPYFD